MQGEMGWCVVLECGMEPPQSSSPSGVSWDVWMPPPPTQSPEKIGAPSNYPGARLFYLSTHQTKSNPDMRNSKLAHTQAGF